MKKKLFFFVLLLMVVLLTIIFFTQKRKQDSNTIKIISVATMRGISAGTETVNGMKIALQEANYQAGGYSISFGVMDNGDADGLWRADLEEEIARRVSSDKDVMIYLGPIDSGATKISLPINNRAGLAQISSINTWPGLTQPGFAIGEPGVFYPTGVRSYFRVCPTDSLQGVYGAIWVGNLNFKNVFIFSDGESYGRGLAAIFEKKLTDLGVNIVGHRDFDREGVDFFEEIKEIADKKPDLIYFSGTTSVGLISLINGISDLNLGVKFMGADGIIDQALLDKTGKNAEGIMLTAIGIPINEIDTDKARSFYNDYVGEFGEEPTIYAGFGYEAMSVALTAINQAGVKDRKIILRELASLNNFSGLFGEWSFDSNGDTSLSLVSANVVKDGDFVFEKILK